MGLGAGIANFFMGILDTFDNIFKAYPTFGFIILAAGFVYYYFYMN